MNVKHMYLALLAAAVVAAFMLRFLDMGAGAFNSGRAIGMTLGMSAPLFLVAALVPTVSVLFSRKQTASAANLTAVGIIVLAAFSCFLYRGIEVQRALVSFPFEVPGCTFSASFPGPVEVKELVVAGELVVAHADFYGREASLRAECWPTNGRFAPTRKAVIAELGKYAYSNGLLDVEFEVSEMDGFVSVVATGWKTVSGKPTTYKAHLLADGASTMRLTAAGFSSGFPQPGIHKFLTSGMPLAAGAR